ncbi:TetR family transcriptional regulator [Cellulomonas sp. NPDC089187]|uniref:TetR family transcriptional regulator n=1 Tax=Cellulomonas sp. NPDC089187 TaxID=3154970 RepID=UPI00343E5B4A
MAWDTERTRARLLDAAVTEFAEHGPAGARIDRVAAAAGVNKERIYSYFGNKHKLFDAVLAHELDRLAQSVPLTPELAEDLGAYAGAVYDYHHGHPHLLRLMAWEGLADDGQLLPDQRLGAYQDKVTAIATAGHDTLDAQVVLTAVLALSSWWFTAPQMVRLVTGRTERDAEAERAALVELVRRVTQPTP